MRLYWSHVWRSRTYRNATAEQRRLIEIRFSLARALQSYRRQRGVTQKELARRLGIAQSTISRAERASLASLDIGVRALIALGCSDAELAAVFDASRNPGVQILRRRAGEKFFPKPRPDPDLDPSDDHRFVRKGDGPFHRLM